MTRPAKIAPLTLKLFVSPVATVSYPAGDWREQFPAVRGKIASDPSKCVGCHACVRDCPTGAIEIIDEGDKKHREFIYLDKCLFCGQCVTTCPKNALHWTTNFELAGFDRGSMRVDCEEPVESPA